MSARSHSIGRPLPGSITGRGGSPLSRRFRPPLVGPIIDALLRLHDLRERVEAHVDALDAYEYTDATDDDWQAAHALLALQHEIADLLSLELSGWSWVGGKRLRVGAAVRAVLYEAMDTEELVYACRHPQIDAIRMAELRCRV